MPFPAFRASEYDRERVTSDPVGESLTKQSFADDCDINVLMARFASGGAVPLPVGFAQGVYADVSDGLSYHEAMNRVIEAQGLFMQLPAALRARFENDPGQFLDFVADPANADEMVKLGIAEKPEAVAPVVPAPPVAVSDKPPEVMPKA